MPGHVTACDTTISRSSTMSCHVKIHPATLYPTKFCRAISPIENQGHYHRFNAPFLTIFASLFSLLTICLFCLFKCRMIISQWVGSFECSLDSKTLTFRPLRANMLKKKRQTKKVLIVKVNTVKNRLFTSSCHPCNSLVVPSPLLSLFSPVIYAFFCRAT